MNSIKGTPEHEEFWRVIREDQEIELERLMHEDIGTLNMNKDYSPCLIVFSDRVIVNPSLR